jgi:hypothetical protein
VHFSFGDSNCGHSTALPQASARPVAGNNFAGGSVKGAVAGGHAVLEFTLVAVALGKDERATSLELTVDEILS